MRARLATALLAISLAVAGCSSEEPNAGPTMPPVTEAPSATPDAVEVPNEAAEATPEGAAEFARFFALEVYEAYLALDPARIERLSAPGCETCERYVASIEEIRTQGGTIGDEYAVDVVDVATPGQDGEVTRAQVTLVLSIGEFVVTGSDGTELVRETADAEAVQSVELVRRGSQWLVQEVSVD